ncbi:MAG: hypothetical protein NVSMB52_15910 [Chloroflexota bacterium]
MNPVVRGSLAGIGATTAMTAVIYAGKAVGLLHTPPPQQITKNAQDSVGISRSQQSDETFNASWLAAHLGYGAGSGAGYTILRDLLPGNTITRGLIFGGSVWAVSYLGVMPALGLYPWPSEDSTSRTVVMIAAHAVFGVSLAEVEEWLRN